MGTPHSVCVDKLQNGVFVAFEDGKYAIFSAALLYATLPQAQRVEDDLEPEVDE